MNIALNKLYDGIVLISIGIILLLNVTGLLDWSIWLFYLNFWPLVLIVAGLRMIFSTKKSYEKLGVIIQAVLWLTVFLAGIIYTIRGDSLAGREVMSYYSVLASDNAENNLPLIYNLKFPFGEYNIRETDNYDLDLLRVVGKYSKNLGEPEITKNIVNSNLEINYRQKEQSFRFDFLNSYTYSMDLILTNRQINTLNVDLGAGKVGLKFDSVNIKNLKEQIGAGEINLTLERSGMIDNIDVKVGAGKATIILPKDYAFKLNYQVGAGSIEVNGNEVGGLGSHADDVYSLNYNSVLNSKDRKIINITANVGAGQIIIQNVGD